MPPPINEDTRRDIGSTNALTSLGDTTKQAQAFFSALESFKSNNVVRATAELIDQIPELKKEIEEQQVKASELDKTWKKERQEHERALNRNLDIYSSKYADLNSSIKALETSLQSAQNDLGKKDMIIKDLEEREVKYKAAQEDHQGALDSKVGQLQRSEKRVNALDAECNKLRQQNQHLVDESTRIQNSLERLESFSVKLSDTDLDDLTEKLKHVWNSSISMIRRYLDKDISNDIIMRSWHEINTTRVFAPELELPQSNSAIAKELRVVKTLGILAKLIDKYIFQPTYLLVEENRFRQLLYDVAEKEPEKERFLRGIMLSIFREQRNKAEKKISTKLIQELMTEVGLGKLFAAEEIPLFEKDLTKILRATQSTWSVVQHSIQLIQPEYEYYEEDMWQEFTLHTEEKEEAKETEGETRQYVNDEDVIELFPAMFAYTEDDEDTQLTPGTLITKSRIHDLQTKEREAGRKQGHDLDQIPSRATRGRGKAGRSMSINNGGGPGIANGKPFLESASSSQQPRK